jgi:ribonuclease D
MTPELIESQAALTALCDELKTQSCIAVDTEFARERTYFPHIGLIQIAGDNLVACIDPLAFDAKPQLAEILLNGAVTKIFHACLQDLEVLDLTLGGKPCPLFDTQLANALMNEDHQISYANLVDRELQIQLTKSQTRTDWLKRPLTKAQLEYAADDVRYLLSLYKQQRAELDALNRSEWMRQECDHLCEKIFNDEAELLHCWKRVKGKERLRGIELAALQAAAVWREQQAIARDRPRRRILPDDILIQIVLNQPKNNSELKRIGRIGKLLGMSELDSLSETLAPVYSLTEAEWPTLKRRQLTQEQSVALTAVLDALRKKASALGISTGMLCNRKDAEKLVLGKRNLPVLEGWRLDCIGKNLLKLFPAGPES